MTITFYERKPDGAAKGSIEYADRGTGAVVLETPTSVWKAIENANPHKVSAITGSLNFEEQLSETQALLEWIEFRVRYIDPLGLDCWARFHPEENKSEKKTPHSAIHFGVSTCLPDGRQITPFFGAAKTKGRDFLAIDTFKRWRNKLMGYSSPDDPSRWRKYRTLIKRTWPAEKKNFIKRLDEKLRSREWKNREEILFWLQSEERIEITRIAESTVSIQHPYWNKPIRLQGYWWCKDWSKFHDQTPFVDRPEEELLADLNQHLARRTVFFEKKYKFSKQKEINERATNLIPIESLSNPGNHEPLFCGSGKTPTGSSTRVEANSRRLRPANPSSGTTIRGNRANLDQIWRAWCGVAKALKHWFLKRKKLFSADRDETVSAEQLAKTKIEVRRLIAESEAEQKLQNPTGQIPPETLRSDPAKNPDGSNSPPSEPGNT